MEHVISLDEAIAMTKAYRSAVPAGMPFAETFNIESLNALLAQPGCTAFRIYYGMKPDGTVHAILVGVDGKGEDMTEGLILEEGIRCPPYCPSNSSLNK